MKPFLAPVSLALFVSVACAQPLRPGQVPLRARSPQGFVPRGWKIEHLVLGDLNRDGATDAALVLVEDKPAKDAQGEATERSRALVVALSGKSGWKRVGFSNQLLLGTRDGGAFYGVVETPVDVSIKNEVLLVEMESGSREVEETTHRLRFEPKRSGVFLIGFDSTVRDRLTTDVTTQSSNFLSGEKRITHLKASSDTSVRQAGRVSRRLKSLESLGENDRYAEGS